MRIDEATVLITGANRGIGLEFARAVLARGARKVYAGMRDTTRMTLAGVEPLQLDVTQAQEVAAAARLCRDVTLLVNNAGIALPGGFLTEDGLEAARLQMETNFFGPLRLSTAFAPVLAGNGGGAILNVLSDTTWTSPAMLSVYGASKAAAWSLTNGLRQELRGQCTQVLGMHMGFVDTDLTRGIDVTKSAPEDVVRRALDALEAGDAEILADERARIAKRGLSVEPALYLRALEP